MAKKTNSAIPPEHMAVIEIIAWKMARKCGPRVDVRDLRQEGVVGYLEALQRYDPSRGGIVEHYVFHRVRGAIRDYIRNSDVLSRKDRATVKKIERTRRALAQELMREPTREEIAQRCELPLERVDEISLKFETVLLQPGDERYAAYEQTSQSWFPGLYIFECDWLVEAWSVLDRRESVILALCIVEELKQRQIARWFGVTESRISQLRTGALRKLQLHLQKKGKEF